MSDPKDIVRTVKAGGCPDKGHRQGKGCKHLQERPISIDGARLREIKAQGLGGPSALVERASIGCCNAFRLAGTLYAELALARLISSYLPMSSVRSAVVGLAMADRNREAQGLHLFRGNCTGYGTMGWRASK
jgi:hypothetical protein